MKSHKFAFTLAELMIVLSIIGILSAILLPVAFQSTPDKDILKFKKANNTLATVVRELVNSEKYYKNNDLAYPTATGPLAPNGSLLALVGWNSISLSDEGWTPRYFCHAFADVVSAKKVECEVDIFDVTTFGLITRISSFSCDEYATCTHVSNLQHQTAIDENCSRILEPSAVLGYDRYNAILTVDNVLFYEPGIAFGRNLKTEATCDPGYVLSKDSMGNDICNDDNGNDFIYHPLCIDIDGIEGPIKPFGYGIRTDGKIKAGARADWWLKRDITKKETDCCPKALNDAGLCDTNDTVCAS